MTGTERDDVCCAAHGSIINQELPLEPIEDPYATLFVTSSVYMEVELPPVLLVAKCKEPVASKQIITTSFKKEPEVVMERYVRLAALPNKLRERVEASVDKIINKKSKKLFSKLEQGDDHAGKEEG
jgi:hypothetical protein